MRLLFRLRDDADVLSDRRGDGGAKGVKVSQSSKLVDVKEHELNEFKEF